jgi:hypothetical protein
MITGKRSAAAIILGLLSMMGLALLWLIMLAPMRWDLRFPGGGQGATLILLSAIGASVTAGILGRRTWFIIATWGVITFLYVWFFLKSPIWY